MKANKSYNPCDDCQYSYSKNGQESSICKICEFADLLVNQQKQGKWLYYSDDRISGWLCSNCKKYSTGKRYFCPECGAKMTFEENS